MIESHRHYGGFVMADTHDTINCPACGTKMKKIFIPKTGFSVDICLDGCGGIFFDNREFQYFDEPDEVLDEMIVQMESKPYLVKPKQDAVRVCPACGSNMVKNHTSVNGNIIVDDCYNCGGKFLDHCELTRIRDEYDTEKERSEAAVRALLYSPEGAELGLSTKSGKVNEKMDKINKSLFGKIVNKMMDK